MSLRDNQSINIICNKSRMFHPSPHTGTQIAHVNSMHCENITQRPKFEKSGNEHASNQKGKQTNMFFINWMRIYGSIPGLVSLGICYYYYKQPEKDGAPSASTMMDHIESDIEKKFEMPFIPTTPMIPGLPLFSKEGDHILKIICAYDCIPQLSYIEGPSSAGKSASVENAVKGRKNTINIVLRGHEPRQALVNALGFYKRCIDDPNPSISELLKCLDNVLLKQRKKLGYGTKSNPIPLIIINDYMANNGDCKIIAGSVLQCIERNLASGMHVNSSNESWNALKLQSGHSSRLNKYFLSYTPQYELEKYKFFRSDDIRKLGGHFGDVFNVLGGCVPIVRRDLQYRQLSTDLLIKLIINGEVIIPTQECKRLVDHIIESEVSTLIKVLRLCAHDSFSAQDVVHILATIGDNNSITPNTINEMRICEHLVSNNIFSHTIHDPKSYIWQRPILAHSFESSHEYLKSVFN